MKHSCTMFGQKFTLLLSLFGDEVYFIKKNVYGCQVDNQLIAMINFSMSTWPDYNAQLFG